jgi:hypothetical protein
MDSRRELAPEETIGRCSRFQKHPKNDQNISFAFMENLDSGGCFSIKAKLITLRNVSAHLRPG